MGFELGNFTHQDITSWPLTRRRPSPIMPLAYKKGVRQGFLT